MSFWKRYKVADQIGFKNGWGFVTDFMNLWIWVVTLQIWSNWYVSTGEEFPHIHNDCYIEVQVKVSVCNRNNAPFFAPAAATAGTTFMIFY